MPNHAAWSGLTPGLQCEGCWIARDRGTECCLGGGGGGSPTCVRILARGKPVQLALVPLRPVPQAPLKQAGHRERRYVILYNNLLGNFTVDM